MAALNFPDSPTLNDEVVLGGKTYKWDGVKWTMIKVITPPPPTASAAAPTITIVTEATDGVTFTLTNNDDNTAIISYEVDDNTGAVELAAAATSSNITVALSAGTYTLTAYATVVGEVATQSTAAVEIVVIEFELLYDSVAAGVTYPVSQIDITGLNITKDDELRLVFTAKGDNASTGNNIGVFPNDETTITNYWRQALLSTGTSVFAGRENNNRLTQPSNRYHSGYADIKISNNDRFVMQSHEIWDIGSTAANQISQFFWNNISTITVSSITKLSIKGDRTITSGSRFRLYKVNTGAA